MTDPAAIATDMEFAAAITRVVAEFQPGTLVETGTYNGHGSTTVICRAMRAAGLADSHLYTIEVNPQRHAEAESHLTECFPGMVTCLLGLSVPSRLLPGDEDIIRLQREAPDDAHRDYMPWDSVAAYRSEVGFHGPEDALGAVARSGPIDFALLDSAGHMGYVEFDYILSLISTPCIFALDDTRHIKHCMSRERIAADPRFRVLAEGGERWGFCIARYNP